MPLVLPSHLSSSPPHLFSLFVPMLLIPRVQRTWETGVAQASTGRMSPHNLPYLPHPQLSRSEGHPRLPVQRRPGQSHRAVDSEHGALCEVTQASMTLLRTCCAPSRWVHPGAEWDQGQPPRTPSVLTGPSACSWAWKCRSTLFAVQHLGGLCAFSMGPHRTRFGTWCPRARVAAPRFVGGDDWPGQTKVKSVLVTSLSASSPKVWAWGLLWPRRKAWTPRAGLVCCVGLQLPRIPLSPRPVHRELQPPGQQRRAELCQRHHSSASKGGVQEQRGDDMVHSNPVPTRRASKQPDHRAWGAGVGAGPGARERQPRDPCDCGAAPRWSSSTCHTWATASVLLDEYTSELMLGGTNTLVLHNTCEVWGARGQEQRRRRPGPPPDPLAP